MSSMNGQEQDQNITFSSRKFSDYQATGVNLERSKINFDDIYCFRITYGLVQAGGDTAMKLAAW